MTNKNEKKVVVIVYEQFFDADDVGDLREAVRAGLDTLREYAGARVVASYAAVDNDTFRAEAVSHVRISTPVEIEIE
jgi:hypothetical protein